MPVNASLSPAPAAAFRLVPAPGPHAVLGRVFLFQDEPRGEPVSKHVVVIEAEGVRLSGFRPGTYTVWVDAPGFAPSLLRGVRLGHGAEAASTLEHGSSVHVRGAAGSAALLATAWSLEDPSYRRTLLAGPRDELVLRGLGRGRHRVVVGREGVAGRALLDTVVVLDGRSEVHLDLRA